jgi:hypothetical protein
MKRYAGNRDPRFVAIHRGGDLDLTKHRLLVCGRLTELNTFCLCLQKSIRATLAPFTQLRSLASFSKSLFVFLSYLEASAQLSSLLEVLRLQA